MGLPHGDADAADDAGRDATQLAERSAERPTKRDASSSHTVRSELPRHRRAFGRYELCYRVAEGGMAEVFLARVRTPEGFARWMAVKIVQPSLARDPRFVTMFLDEARLAARIHHPNACSVYDFGEVLGTYFLSMEYLNGESLSSLIRHTIHTTPLPRDLAVRVVADAARGLHAAHELQDTHGQNAGVVHRDVSPQNIFVLYDGVAKIVDFGVARWTEKIGERTATGEVRGKLAYLAPEQLLGFPVDRGVDVFALGIVLYEATLLRRLFKSATDAATMHAVLNAEIPLPSEVDSTYPPELERIVLRALRRDRSERYGTIDEIVRELETYLAKTGHAPTATDLADFLATAFADRMRARAVVLRNIEAFDLPSDEVYTSVDSAAYVTQWDETLRIAGFRAVGAETTFGTLIEPGALIDTRTASVTLGADDLGTTVIASRTAGADENALRAAIALPPTQHRRIPMPALAALVAVAIASAFGVYSLAHRTPAPRDVQQESAAPVPVPPDPVRTLVAPVAVSAAPGPTFATASDAAVAAAIPPAVRGSVRPAPSTRSRSGEAGAHRQLLHHYE